MAEPENLAARVARLIARAREQALYGIELLRGASAVLLERAARDIRNSGVRLIRTETLRRELHRRVVKAQERELRTRQADASRATTAAPGHIREEP